MSKITQDARDRCTAHTLSEQLQKVRDSERMAEYRRRNGGDDQSAINLHLEHDTAWSGQHARLTNPKGWDEADSH